VLASEHADFHKDWEFGGWYNVYIDSTDRTDYVQSVHKFQNDEFTLTDLIPDHRYDIKLSYENYWGEGPISSAIYFWPQSSPEKVTIVSHEREIYTYIYNQTSPGIFSTSWNYPNDNGGYIFAYMHC
jgi:hypothetical protein